MRTISYRLSVSLGNGAVVFAPSVISIVGFHQQQPASMLWLAVLWVFVVTVKPIELGIEAWNVLRRRNIDKHAPEYIGQVTRVDDPNIIRVNLSSRESWKPDRLHTACLPGDRRVHVLPLFVQTQDNELMGTGFCCDGAARNRSHWVKSGQQRMGGQLQKYSSASPEMGKTPNSLASLWKTRISH